VIALVAVARALTLEEAVARAAEVNPLGVVAEIEWRQLQLEAAETWSALTITPEIGAERTWVRGTEVSDSRVEVSLGLLNPTGWFDALEQSAQARSARGVAEATVLDAQYAAAVLYFEALTARRAVELATRSLAEGEATLEVTRARAAAGIEPALHAQAAEAHVVRARAGLGLARARLDNARARLARALEQDVGEIADAPLPTPPAGATRSPWIAASDALIDAARLEHAEAWAELLPSATLSAETNPTADYWTVTLQGTWTVDGVGPVLRARWAALETRKQRVYRDGLRRDFDVGIETGANEARALAGVAEAARVEEELAQAALEAGLAQLRAGLIDGLDVVQLQDDVLDARRDRVDAELEQAYAVLEARRLAGEAW
jgi:outer membrane protein TolC